MAAMLIPWIIFWISVSINPDMGTILTWMVCAWIPLLFHRHELVIWDQLSIAATAILALTARLSGNGEISTSIGYLVFGMFWLTSCLTGEPLCAAYVKHNYGGDQALKNPLFMKTNYILAGCWGALYVMTAGWTWLLRKAGYGDLLILVNNLVPVIMGIFTAWFEKWYPAWLAGGKRSVLILPRREMDRQGRDS